MHEHTHTHNATRIIGPISFSEIPPLNSHRCVTRVLTPFLNTYLSTTGPMPFPPTQTVQQLTSQTILCTLYKVFFGDAIISRGLWPPCFQEMNLCYELLLCGTLKNKVYSNNTRTENDQKESILYIVFTFHHQDLNVQWTMCLLDLTCVCELTKTISSTFFKCGE
jgi:hypothetical protein